MKKLIICIILLQAAICSGYEFINTSDGKLSIKSEVLIGGSPDTGYQLAVDGQIFSTDDLQVSDSLYKKNVVPIDSSLIKMLKIRGVTFEWRRDEFPNKNFQPGQKLGIIAQELELIYPQAVFTSNNGFKSISMSSLIPVLIEAIKEQQQQIDALEQRVSQLENN